MAGSPFDPSAVAAFSFVDFDWDDAAAEVRLRYALDGHRFEELIRFEDTAGGRAATGTPAFERCLRYLHLAAGVSYYKAAAPPRAVVETGGLSEEERAFLTDLYDHGLREFAYRNDLPIPTGPEFEADAGEIEPAGPVGLPERAAVPLGGGKDSAVVIAALAETKPLLLTVNSNQTSEAVARRSGLDYVRIVRRLSPHLFELNDNGARNGHVPITAIVSLIAAAGAFVYGYDAVVMANERSASAATRHRNGRAVNHQWSKGIGFETALASLLRRNVASDLSYFSLLRPYSELAVGRALAALPEYHDVFQSCNANFRAGRSDAHGWCGDCPKCRFVFLILAPFLSPDRLVAIFGSNLLDDAAQVTGYRELADTGDSRPFECVGEPQEIMAAFGILASRQEWRDLVVVRAIAAPPADGSDYLEPAPAGSIPERERALIAAIMSPGDAAL